MKKPAGSGINGTGDPLTDLLIGIVGGDGLQSGDVTDLVEETVGNGTVGRHVEGSGLHSWADGQADLGAHMSVCLGGKRGYRVMYRSTVDCTFRNASCASGGSWAAGLWRGGML